MIGMRSFAYLRYPTMGHCLRQALLLELLALNEAGAKAQDVLGEQPEHTPVGEAEPELGKLKVIALDLSRLSSLIH